MKAFIVLSSDSKDQQNDDMVKELQNHVTHNTASWMKPHVVRSRDKQFDSVTFEPQNTEMTSAIGSDNRSFAVSGHMIQKTPCWRANCALGHPKQRKLKLSWFVLDVRGATLLSSDTNCKGPIGLRANILQITPC